jgi:hypothetical protein
MFSIEQRSNNPLNNSSSKQLFSFPKSHRFDNKPPSSSPDAFYHPELKTNQQTFTFGKSHRIKTESAHKESQGPFFYNIEGEIERALKKKSGVKILYGREVTHLLSRIASQRESSSCRILLVLATTTQIPKPSSRASPVSVPSLTTCAIKPSKKTLCQALEPTA